MNIENQLGEFRITGKMKIGTFAECSTVGNDYKLETGGLAVFSETYANWAEAKNIWQARINKRLAVKKTRKIPWIMGRDVIGKHNDEIIASQ